MAEVSPSPGLVRFGVFELDLRSGELRKAGVRVGLQEQPLQFLTALLEKPGDLVTREQLRQRLWPGGTFVDFEHGLNAVVNRLRDTLGDSAESPRFIETLPRRGYRFIAPVDGARAVAESVQPEARIPEAWIGVTPWRRAGLSLRARRGWVVAIAGSLVAVVAGGAWLRQRTPAVDGRTPRLVPLTTLAGQEDWPAFAPDGEQIAFGWTGEKDDNADIYVTLVGSTDVRRVTTDPGDDYAPSWSPDGRRIAFLRRVGNAARIHIASALGGPDVKVSDFPVAAGLTSALIASKITWSPDGRHIVAGRDPGNDTGPSTGLYLIPTEGGEPRPITRPKRPTFDFSPAFSPDGRRLAYASCDHVGLFLPWYAPVDCHVRVVDIDDTFAPTAAARTLMPQPVDELDGVTWSRDGESVIFFGAGPGAVYIWRLWVDGTRPPERIEAAGPHAQHPATVASRDRLVFSQYDWDAHLYRFNAGFPAERVAASSSFESNPAFSPDGRRIAFTSGRSGDVAIWVAAADGSEGRQLTHGMWSWPGSPRWSPDGTVIAFDGRRADGSFHIWTIDPAGGAPRQITRDAGDQTAPTWSHDGQWIYFSGHRDSGRDIWRVRATGGSSEQVTRTGSGFLAFEAGDGTSVLYQPKNGDSALLLMPLVGTAPRQLVDCVRSSAFATAGRTVVYVACDRGSNPSLHALDMVSGQKRLLGKLEKFEPETSHVNLAVSPDGKAILYTGLVRRGGDLMLIENFR